MSNLYQLEREYSSTEAQAAIERQVSNLHLSFDYLVNDSKKEITHLELYNSQGQCISAGSGKGTNCQVGAIAEALEHYSLEKFDENINKRASFKKIKSQPQLKTDKLIQSITHDSYVEVTPFIDKTYGAVVDVPISYINPFYAGDETEVDQILGRYCSNLGTSFGISYNESYLHALNEAIERHYVSYYYMSCLGINTSVKWKEYKYTNNKHDQKRKMIREKHGDVYTVVAQTQFSNYVAVTVLQHSKSVKLQMAQVGAGASISAELAISRSLDEVMQCVELYSEEEYFEDRYAKEQILEFPKLNALIQLGNRGRGEKFQLLDMPTMTVKRQVEILDKQLRHYGYTPLTRNLMNCGEMNVIQVFIPGMERFHLIRSGNLVAPMMETEE